MLTTNAARKACLAAPISMEEQVTQYVAGFAKLGHPQLLHTITDLEKRIKASISAQAKAAAKPVSASNKLLKQLAELGFTPTAAAAQQHSYRSNT